MDVNVSNLKRYFGGTKAVDGVSFSFSSGHIVGFVGPNGAGKTTTMRILATLDEPTEGDATIDGISVVDEPEKARRLVGFMPDTLPTHRDMTVHEYLDFFARAYGLRGVNRDSLVERVEEFTNLTGINRKFLRDLSKGMKQRVSLARSLVHDPPVLVLDEPANALDPRARIELRELLKVLADQGKAILVSSHILTELSEMCNGVVIVEQGRMLRAGQMDHVVEAENIERTVIIRCEGPIDALQRALLESPLVRESRIAGPVVEAEVNGGDDVCGDLLRQLVTAGVRIVEFHQRRADLEDIFMTVTKGQVQ
ncbi:MAG TPA: ABC transporter ATP-binding protein [Pirellulales bacterium]|nr:ABC transporter ATP-binding protein [Pirellulales bacterium]